MESKQIVMIERFYETFQSMIIYFEPVEGIHNKVQHRETSYFFELGRIGNTSNFRKLQSYNNIKKVN